MAQHLRAHVTLAKDLGLVPSTHTKHTHSTHAYMQALTCVCTRHTHTVQNTDACTINQSKECPFREL